MIRKIRFFVLAMMLAIPVSASAIQLTDYTFPDTFYQEAYATGRFNLNSGNQPQTSYNGGVQLDYNVDYNTLPQTFHFDVKGALDFEKDTQETPGKDDSREWYNVDAKTNFDQYYKDTNFLGYGSVNFGYRKQRGQDDADDPYIKFGVGVGYGRIIVATPLAKAMRVIEDLKKYSVISVEPSDACYLELARMIDKQSEFRSKYGTKDYEQYWYKELEDILNKEGLLKSGHLGVVGVIRMREVLVAEPFPTHYGFRHGWIAKVGIGYIASNWNGDDEDPSLDAQFQYALPINNNLQFVEDFRYSTILGGDVGHQFDNTMSLAYKISDRILWENEWVLSVLLPKDDESEDIYSNTLNSVFRYYISNTVDLNLTLRLSHLDDGIDDNGNDDVEKAIVFGVTYRLK
jgi:hypothetical protein